MWRRYSARATGLANLLELDYCARPQLHADSIYTVSDMNLGAVILIGTLNLILGVVLYVPSRFLIRRKLRKDPRYAHQRVTKVGLFVFGMMVFILVCGFSLEYLAPESRFGQLVRTAKGRLIDGLLVAAVFWTVEILLRRKGIRPIEKVNTDDL